MIVLLASVSLFALVVTSRPTGLNDFAPTPTFQTAIQAAFRIHPGQDDLKLDTARLHAQKSKPQFEYLSEHRAENIASFKISPVVKPQFEAFLEETPDRQDAFDTNDELDDARVDHITSEPVALEPIVNDQREAATGETPRTPLVVMAFSCVAAFLALACIALTLYIIKSLRSQVLASKRAWELLPRFWGRPRSSVSQENTSVTAKEHLLGGGCLLLQTEVEEQRLLHAEQGSAERRDFRMEDKLPHLDSASDMDSEWDDVDEKYQDALDTTPLPIIHDLPLEEHVSHQSHLGNPPLSSWESRPFDQPRGDRSAPLMRELCSSRPGWSVRAIDSPALGLSSREGGGVDSTTQSLIYPQRRAYRSAVPEFDIALAMQLRPGLGIGADSAWMVRFLMAIFGWFAVALTGNTR